MRRAQPPPLFPLLFAAVLAAVVAGTCPWTTGLYDGATTGNVTIADAGLTSPPRCASVPCACNAKTSLVTSSAASASAEADGRDGEGVPARTVIAMNAIRLYKLGEAVVEQREKLKAAKADRRDLMVDELHSRISKLEGNNRLQRAASF